MASSRPLIWALTAFAALAPGLPIALSGYPQHLTSVVPLWGFMLYVVVQGRRTVRPELLWILGSLVWVFCYGSAGGPFQSDALLNRLAHASCSAVLAGLLCWELSVLLIARHRTLGSAALGWACAMATGAGMELMEGAVAWNDVQPTRFHDTMFDLTADAAGAVAGVVLAAWVVRRERVRRPRP